MNASNRKALLFTVLYLAYLLPGLYSTLAVLELVLLMGHGSGTYSDYGKSAGEVVAAYAFLALNLLWLVFGTTMMVREFRYRIRLWRYVLVLLLAWLVVLPITYIYLLGVGHS